MTRTSGLIERTLERAIGHPVANLSFAMMRGYIHAIKDRGVDMLHTARPFSHYRKIFYYNQSESWVLSSLQNCRVVDIGCGYTPYSRESMFQVCREVGIDFYGIDPILDDELTLGWRDKALAKATGARSGLDTSLAGLDKAISATAQSLPFEDASVDEILCSYLLFVWIEDEAILNDIFKEFYRVLKADGVARIYPLHDWRFFDFRSSDLKASLRQFDIQQEFVHGRGDFRIQPSFVTKFSKKVKA